MHISHLEIPNNAHLMLSLVYIKGTFCPISNDGTSSQLVECLRVTRRERKWEEKNEGGGRGRRRDQEGKREVGDMEEGKIGEVTGEEQGSREEVIKRR